MNNEQINKIFLDKLPRHNNGRHKGDIDWNNSIGYKVKGIYNYITFEVEIVEYGGYKKRYLTIKYKNKIYYIMVSHFKRCQFGNILGVKTSKFKLDINTAIKDKNRDIIITKRKIVQETIVDKRGKSLINKKLYKYSCNICGFDCGEHWNIKEKQYKDELWLTESNINNGCGCAYCNGNNIIIKGINDIATTHPHLIKYFANIEDAYTHTYGSSDKV